MSPTEANYLDFVLAISSQKLNSGTGLRKVGNCHKRTNATTERSLDSL